MSNYSSQVCKYEDKNGVKYRVAYRYIGKDGKRHNSTKRGFQLQKDAKQWQRDELPKVIKELEQTKSDNSFKTVSELAKSYLENSHVRDRESTYQTKLNLISTKILPTLGEKKVSDIDEDDIEEWQNNLIMSHENKGKNYSPTYIHTINSAFIAMLNYAVKHKYISENPMNHTDSIGQKEGEERKFWTFEEYQAFSKAVQDKPMSYYAFEVLFWTGIRVGELLALTLSDIDFENNTLRIDESYQRIHGKDYITPPKTKKSKRTIFIPENLTNELKEYTDGLHGINDNSRIFPVTKSFMKHEIERGCKISGVKKIVVHGIRHSHITFLETLGTSILDVAWRVGHTKVDTTMIYSHKNIESDSKLAKELNEIMGTKADVK